MIYPYVPQFFAGCMLSTLRKICPAILIQALSFNNWLNNSNKTVFTPNL